MPMIQTPGPTPKPTIAATLQLVEDEDDVEYEND